jgi:hypothetical protein
MSYRGRECPQLRNSTGFNRPAAHIEETLTWNASVVFPFLDRRARTSSVSLTAVLEGTTPFNRNLLFSFKKFALARPLHRSGKPAAKETK